MKGKKMGKVMRILERGNLEEMLAVYEQVVGEQEVVVVAGGGDEESW